MPPEEETRLCEQLKARIEEYNKKDRQALRRAREEREKWFQLRIEAGEKNRLGPERT